MVQGRGKNERGGQEPLTERARQGDSEAFSELVCIHRARILGMARRIVHDPSAAEDVVQEALVQAFLHIDRLSNVDRFVPWLNRIVRNQALMKRRSDERSSRESTFTGMISWKKEQADDESKWGRFDDMLYRMTRARGSDEMVDPEAELMRREFYGALKIMLHSLSSREREIFEAHFFSQLDPKEIAELLGMTEGSVYKSLSRSKSKVKDARVRHDLRNRLDDTEDERERRAMVMLSSRIGADVWQSGASSIAVCIHQILRFTGDPHTGISDVMGLSGHAFRLNLERERIDVSGPSMYFWEPVFEAGLRRLGYMMTHVGDGGIAPSAYQLGEAVALARRTIAYGIPAVAWDLNGPEFGLLYGYDDDRQLFTVAVQGSEALALPYDKLGRGKDGGLFVMAVNRLPLNGTNPDDETPRLIADLMAHAYGERTFAGYVSGLQAYDAWREAHHIGAIDLLGNAYCLRLTLNAREHAVRFLRSWCRRWEGDRFRFAFEAEGHYYDAVNLLAQLVEVFPFPNGGNIYDQVTTSKAEKLLQKIKYCEEAGIESLGRLACCF